MVIVVLALEVYVTPMDVIKIRYRKIHNKMEDNNLIDFFIFLLKGNCYEI